MQKLPNFDKAFDYENLFYHTCQVSRIGKTLAHYELFKMISGIAGEIVECGIFKGTSMCRFASFRELFGTSATKKIIGFDIFGKFPKTNYSLDQNARKNFISVAGNQSISKENLLKILKKKGIAKNIELIKGDITKTIPKYIKSHPELRISLLNLDVDIYEPSVTILEELFPLITKGGILILDDYGKFPGENKAVEDYFKNKKIKIQTFPFSKTPSFIIKQ